MAVLQYTSLINTVATTVTSGSTTTLVNTSATIQIFTGTANQTLVLPVATTFTKPGISYEFYNFSSGSISVEYQDSSALQTISPNSTLIVNLYNNTTANGQWTTLTNSTVPAINAPTVQTFLSGSGTYTTPTSPTPLYLKVTMIGGGGSGGGGNPSTTVPGNNGTTTTFGTSLLTATGGGGGGTASSSVATVNSPAKQLIAISGGAPSGGSDLSSNASGVSGQSGPFGGAGGAGGTSSAGYAAVANSGAGGGGGSSNGSGGYGGGGGAPGAFIVATIDSPSASYTYSVGTGGPSVASGNFASGAGGSGVIIVEEFYQ